MISREHWRSSTRRRATYSDCERHRYSLEIQWADIADDPGLERLRRLACIGLNPSTATERANDPTVARLEKWARENGYSSLVMLNAYAFRSTDRHAMLRSPDRRCEVADHVIRSEAILSKTVVACWSNDVEPSRLCELRNLLMGISLHCFHVNKSGSPAHPLYLPGPFKLHPYAIQGE